MSHNFIIHHETSLFHGDCSNAMSMHLLNWVEKTVLYIQSTGQLNIFVDLNNGKLPKFCNTKNKNNTEIIDKVDKWQDDPEHWLIERLLR